MSTFLTLTFPSLLKSFYEPTTFLDSSCLFGSNSRVSVGNNGEKMGVRFGSVGGL